jgi:hypothetical protein
MPVTEAKVLVPVPESGTTDSIDNVLVATSEGNVKRQVTTVGDPSNPAARQAVTNSRPASNAYAAAVRVIPLSYDSGLFTLDGPDPLFIVEGEIRVSRLLLINLTSEPQTVSMTDGDGLIYMEDYPLQPNDFKVFDLGGVRFAGGLKIGTPGTGVNCQILGDQ